MKKCSFLNHLEVRLKYSAARSIFNSLLGTRVSSDVETLRPMPPGGYSTNV